MDTFNKITAPAGEKLRQLQKIVHDIKKNDGGFMQKFKKMTNKAPPNVPRRDYIPGTMEDEEEEWSDDLSDYENPNEHSDQEMYMVPSEDGDDSYEPPPNANDNKFPPKFKFPDRNGDYADKPETRQLPTIPTEKLTKPTRPVPKPNEPFPKSSQTLPQGTHRMNTPNKPLPKPIASPRFQPSSLPPAMNKKTASQGHKMSTAGDDYIDPEDDNYIEPTQSSPNPMPFKPPTINRGNKPLPPPLSKCPNARAPDGEESELYEVPENEAVPSPAPKRDILPFPRTNPQPKLEVQEEYEICDDLANKPEPPSRPAPSPLPRNGKAKLLPPKPKTTNLPARDVNSNIEKPPVLERQRIPSTGAELPPLPPSHKLQLPKPHVISVQKPLEGLNRHVVSANRHGSSVEQDAGVLNKDWYAAVCDRKAAEEALQVSCKDGSFIVRKSSGQDSKQPFTLVVFYNRRVYNIPVRYIESTRQYALGREKSGEEKFSSVAEMIENHKRNPLVLIDSQNNTKDSTKLKHAVKVH